MTRWVIFCRARSLEARRLYPRKQSRRLLASAAIEGQTGRLVRGIVRNNAADVTPSGQDQWHFASDGGNSLVRLAALRLRGRSLRVRSSLSGCAG